MGKKTKVPEAHSPAGIVNRDIIQRLNFLYQASAYLNSTTLEPHASPATVENNQPSSSKRPQTCRRVTPTDLSCSYVRCMKTIGRKTVLKMDPSIKRTICKGCNTVLIPGSTVSFRVKRSPYHKHAISYTCEACGLSRLFPASPTISQDDAASIDAHAMDPEREPIEGIHGSSRSRVIKPRAKHRMSKMPPLFARNAGHIVLRGNERWTDDATQDHGNYSY